MTQQSAACVNPMNQALSQALFGQSGRQPDDPRMLIPDQIAALTRERDRARAQAASLTRELVMARESVAWFAQECDRLDRVRLAADQQQAVVCKTRCSHDEPEPAGRYGLIRDQARDVTADTDLCPFLDPAAPPCSTGHVMPLRALTHAKQAVGLLW